MPIEEETRVKATTYIDAHLFDERLTRAGFSFIHNSALVDLITLELKSARYVYRLMEMLDLRDTFSYPFLKFQLVQYAGIFEAAIDHIIFDRVYQSGRLRKLVEEVRCDLERQTALVRVTGLSSKAEIKFDGAEAHMAVFKESRKSRINIKFSDKVAACETISFIDARLAAEINDFYDLRSSVHLSASLKKSIAIEVEDARRGFRRVNGFCENVKRCLKKYREPILPLIAPES